MAKSQHGISHVVVAELLTDGSATEAPTFGEVIAWPGATKVAVAPSSKSTTLAADNDPNYDVIVGGPGGELTVTSSILPDELREKFFGYYRDADGILAHVPGSTGKFAVGYQVELHGGDEDGRRVWMYKCTPELPSADHQTDGDDVQFGSDEVKFTYGQINNKGAKMPSASADSTSAKYAAFLDAVTLPGAKNAAGAGA